MIKSSSHQVICRVYRDRGSPEEAHGPGPDLDIQKERLPPADCEQVCRVYREKLYTGSFRDIDAQNVLAHSLLVVQGGSGK